MNSNSLATVSRAQLVRDLRALGISEGDVVFFHSSLKSLGVVEGGPDTVVDAFVEAVGPDGTVAVPTLIPALRGPRDLFDPGTSPSEVGLITETLRRRPRAHRSRHPTHSVAAIGARAAELTAGHYPADPWRETPWGDAAFSEASPWGLLVRWNAKYLLLGVDFDTCTLLHYVQACYVERHQPHYARQIAYPRFDFLAMGRRIEERGLVQHGEVGQARARLMPASELARAALDILENEPHGIGPDPGFASWLEHVKGRSLTLRGGVAAAPLDIPGWERTGDGTSLQARVFWVADESSTLAIVSLSLLGLAVPDAAVVREAVGRALEIEPEQVFLCFSHVHSGPPLLDEDGIEETALPHIVEASVRAARAARAASGPIRIGVARREVDGVSRVRRIMLADGTTSCLRRAVPSTWHRGRPDSWKGGEFWLRPEAGLNRILTVLRIEDAGGKPIGCLYNFAGHPLPDFLGYAADRVEGGMAHEGSDGFVCLITNGALGNVDVPFETPRRGKVREKLLPWLGEVFAYAILETLARAEVEDGGRLAMAREEIFLPLNPRFRAIQTGEWDGPQSGYSRPKRYRAVDRFLADDGLHAEVQALRLGPLTLIGIPGELAAEIGERITAGTHLEPAALVGLANGECFYLMSAEAHRRGGYETDPRCWSLSDGRAEMIVRAAATRCLARLERMCQVGSVRSST